MVRKQFPSEQSTAHEPWTIRPLEPSDNTATGDDSPSPQGEGRREGETNDRSLLILGIWNFLEVWILNLEFSARTVASRPTIPPLLGERAGLPAVLSAVAFLPAKVSTTAGAKAEALAKEGVRADLSRRSKAKADVSCPQSLLFYPLSFSLYPFRPVIAFSA
jgi:hypothetical protein